MSMAWSARCACRVTRPATASCSPAAWRRCAWMPASSSVSIRTSPAWSSMAIASAACASAARWKPPTASWSRWAATRRRWSHRWACACRCPHGRATR
ncbi:hypothetical protein G6F59_017016 [Rhizopus arrhizus]|nr:hypothetical protein G6F59_017016 [Rhizopus arrhizus]